MTLEEFARHAEVWGADITRWPKTVRTQAAKMASLPDAKAILAAQRRLDRLLADAVPEVEQARIDRAVYAVVTRLAEEAPRRRLTDLLPGWLIPATGFACAVVLGALAALSGPLADTGHEDMRAVLTMIFDAGIFGQGWIVL